MLHKVKIYVFQPNRARQGGPVPRKQQALLEESEIQLERNILFQIWFTPTGNKLVRMGAA